MKKTLIIVGAALLIGANALAQNLNPTVEVTNIYAREATGIEKPAQLLEVPDSVLRFNLDFDYSVRRAPYKGSYEFKPYLVQLRPQPRPATEGSLYVKLGAGYSFHPEASLVWTPLKKNNFRLNLYADHQSYFGNFKQIWVSEGALQDNGNRYYGMQMRTQAGADALYGWSGGTVSADASYKNIGSTLLDGRNVYHHFFQGQARVKSNPDAAFAYEAGTRVSVLGGYLAETHTVSDALLGTHFGFHYVRLGLGLETVSEEAGYAGNVSISPRYVFEAGRFQLDLGVKFSILYRSEDIAYYYPHKGGIVFPDARVSIALVQDVLTAYASATGGNHMNVYSDLLDTNPFLPSFAWYPDTSVERVNAAVGVRGNVAERFHYDAKVGYSWWQNALLYGYGPVLPAMGYEENLSRFYADASLGWKADYLDVDAHLLYQYSTTVDASDLFAPPAFTAQFKALYKWGKRFRGGVTLDARTDTESSTLTLPGYVDLGLYSDFQMSRRFGVWLRAGNLLGTTIQYVPGYAQHGPWVTVGLVFTL